MNKWIASALAGIVMTGAATVAEARTKSFVIDGVAFAQPGGTPVDPGGQELNDAAEDYFRFGFTLPRDYKKNSPVTITFKTMSSIAPCTAVMHVPNVFRLRAGSQWENGSGPTSGMVGRTITYPATPYTVINASFTLRKPTAGHVTGQKAGDQIIIAMKRQGNDPADACLDSIDFTSAKVVYTVR